MYNIIDKKQETFIKVFSIRKFLNTIKEIWAIKSEWSFIQA